ncbi:MAG TPA: hypothetical protein VG013_18770 [Gemmataceae bacterium]|jgi:TIGR03009 family protein|nr:hypothetical protein [Gemmataceae bacterium]
MHVRSLSALVVVLLIAADAPKQPPRKAVDKARADARLDALLRDWEKARTRVRDMHCEFVWTMQDRTFGDKTTFTGRVFFKSPDLLRADVKDGKGQLQYIVLLTKKGVRYYDFHARQESFIETRSGHQQRVDSCWLLEWLDRWVGRLSQRVQWTFVGMPVGDLRARYRVRLTKEDERWAYIEAKPRMAEDRADFEKMEVVLSKKTHLLRRTWYLQPNGNEITVDIKHVETDVSPPISLKSMSSDLPRGWERNSLPAEDEKEHPAPRKRDRKP